MRNLVMLSTLMMFENAASLALYTAQGIKLVARGGGSSSEGGVLLSLLVPVLLGAGWAYVYYIADTTRGEQYQAPASVLKHEEYQ